MENLKTGKMLHALALRVRADCTFRQALLANSPWILASQGVILPQELENAFVERVREYQDPIEGQTELGDVELIMAFCVGHVDWYLRHVQKHGF